MSIENEYVELIKPYRAIHHYYDAVEKIAKEAFLSFNKEEIEHFFILFEKTHGEKSRTYSYLRKYYDSFKTAQKPLTHFDLRNIITVILPCLPLAQQYECMLYEVLDIVQKQRISFNHQGFRTIETTKALRIYEQYYEALKNLPKMPSQWFHAQSYETEDRQAIMRAVTYIFIRKMKASRELFIEDLKIIAQHFKYLAKGTQYFIKFLGLKVNIIHYEFSFNRSFQIIIPDLPAPVGKFAPMLKEYLAKELAEDDENSSLQIFQKDLFEKDFATIITQYKQTKKGGKKTNVSFVLEGSAGFVKMETVNFWSWFDKLSGRDRGFLEVVSLLMVFPLGGWSIAFILAIFSGNIDTIAMAVMAFFLILFVCSILTLGAYLVYFFVYEISSAVVNLFTKNITTLTLEDAQDKSLAHKFQMEDYIKIIEDSKNIKKNFKETLQAKSSKDNKDILNLLLIDLHEKLCAKLKKYYLNYSHDMYNNMPFSWLLGMYKIAWNFLEAFTVLDMAKYVDATWSYEEKQECLQILKHLIKLKIQKSYYYFMMVSKNTLNKGIEIRIYLGNISETSFSICGETRCFWKNKTKINEITRLFERYLQTFDENIYSPALIAWATEELYLTNNHDFLYEEEQIMMYVESLDEAKRNKNFIIFPLIIESEEGVLYI